MSEEPKPTEWLRRMANGEPMIEFSIDGPLKLRRHPDGSLTIDFVLGRLGSIEAPAWGRAILTPDTIAHLLATLNTDGMPTKH